MASKRALLSELTGILLILLGLLRGVGGLALLLKGATGPEMHASPQAAHLLGALLLATCVLLVLAGLGVLRRRKWAWPLSQASLVIFVLGGLINGRLLFGSPKLAGTVGSIIFALVIYAALWQTQRDGEV
jgi:hypothetical protein